MPDKTHSSKVETSLPPLPNGRTRYVCLQWIRDTHGPHIRKPPPRGVRAANGIIWGHDLTDFMWIERIPGVSIMTIWSRSMIKEFGENYNAEEWKEQDERQKPRRRHPWPVLKLPRKIMELGMHGTHIGIIDEGCDRHCHPNYTPKYRIDIDEDDDFEDASNNDNINPEFKELVSRMFPNMTDALEALLPNNGPEPLKSSVGLPYTILWAPEIRDSFAINKGSYRGDMHPMNLLYDRAGLPMGFLGDRDLLELDDAGLLMDEVGLIDIPSALEKLQVSAPVTVEAATLDLDVCVMDEDDDGPRSDSAKVSNHDPEEPDGNQESVATQVNSAESDSDESGSSSSSSHSALNTGTTAKTDEEYPSEHKKAPYDSPYSVKNIPKLEEFIPTAFFPDILIVHDPHHVTLDEVHSSSHRSGKDQNGVPFQRTKRYIRVLPKLPGEEESQEPIKIKPGVPQRIAHLYLHKMNGLGTGHHSIVYRAPLALPSPLSAHSRNGNVTVAVKTSLALKTARTLLQNEAVIYNEFPKDLMEDWCGYNLVTPIKHPVPVGPVVPKFFGYYLPENVSFGGALDRSTASPILLLEECGEPVNPSKFTFDDRSECYSILSRLHLSNFLQGSAYVRNILVQPGPLTAPPKERSSKTPSFRVIDFGRAQSWNTFVGPNPSQNRVRQKEREWWNLYNKEAKNAQEELRIVDFDF